MIILLTGKPGVGKSTVIEKFIGLNKEPAEWVVTSGIPRPQGDRGGFEATNSDGVRRIISHKTDIDSSIVVGENHVDLAAVDAMFADALRVDSISDDQIIIVDEIGPIQLLSPKFAAALERVFNSEVNLVATIHYNDERLDRHRNSPKALLLEVAPANRDMLPEALVVLTKNRQVIDRLSPEQKAVFFKLARNYTDNAKPVQLQKLAENSPRYVLGDRVHRDNENSWTITGDHGNYTVRLRDGKYTCSCDLFNGLGKYVEQPGDCSHLQAVIISETS